MDINKIIIICLVIIIVVLATGVGFLLGQQQSTNNVTNVTNTIQDNNTTNNTSDVKATITQDTSNSDEQEQIDYNSQNSEYFKSDADGSYHKKQPGGHYYYAPDAVTGEWSYWADKSY